ncbi:LOW QUALITY PROTEIN: SNW domain-containing protein 1-like [Ctenodactylus gundi]
MHQGSPPSRRPHPGKNTVRERFRRVVPAALHTCVTQRRETRCVQLRPGSGFRGKSLHLPGRDPAWRSMRYEIKIGMNVKPVLTRAAAPDVPSFLNGLVRGDHKCGVRHPAWLLGDSEVEWSLAAAQGSQSQVGDGKKPGFPEARAAELELEGSAWRSQLFCPWKKIALTSFLPAPTQLSQDQLAEEKARLQRSRQASLVSSRREPPPYGYRKGWIPLLLEDFGDGGAFPETHVAQYPLDMGRKKKMSNALAIQVDAEGKIKYEAIAQQGQSKDKVTYTKYTDRVPKEVMNADDPDLQRPDEEAIKEITEKTRVALEKSVSQKVAATMPVRAADKLAPAHYIRYTPSQQDVAFNSGANRVIRMVEMQKDPIEPLKFKINKKIPRGPPSPPAPVVHSPSRKMTVKEQQEWKIPPCISNWKNAKGYTIPLDKRLAADGRGLQRVHINENFAKLAEALYIADQKAREAVEMHAQVERKMAQKEKEKHEEKLREMAQKARERRAVIKTHVEKEDGEARERDEIRHDRQKERQHDRNLYRAVPDKRSKLQRNENRDINEVIALGVPNPQTSNEVQYDQRLFNQSKGMDSVFAGGEDEIYNVYDQPWRGGKNMAQSIYRPSKNLDKDMYGDDLEARIKTNRFVPDKEFSGSDRKRGQEGPVQFEEDPFGLDKFLEEAKQHGGSKRPSDSSSHPIQHEHEGKKRRVDTPLSKANELLTTTPVMQVMGFSLRERVLAVAGLGGSPATEERGAAHPERGQTPGRGRALQAGSAGSEGTVRPGAGGLRAARNRRPRAPERPGCGASAGRGPTSRLQAS